MTFTRAIFTISTSAALVLAAQLPSFAAPTTLSYITGHPQCTTQPAQTPNPSVVRPNLAGDAWFQVHPPVGYGFSRSAVDDMVNDFMWRPLVLRQEDVAASGPKVTPALPSKPMPLTLVTACS